MVVRSIWEGIRNNKVVSAVLLFLVVLIILPIDELFIITLLVVGPFGAIVFLAIVAVGILAGRRTSTGQEYWEKARKRL